MPDVVRVDGVVDGAAGLKEASKLFAGEGQGDVHENLGGHICERLGLARAAGGSAREGVLRRSAVLHVVS